MHHSNLNLGLHGRRDKSRKKLSEVFGSLGSERKCLDCTFDSLVLFGGSCPCGCLHSCIFQLGHCDSYQTSVDELTGHLPVDLTLSQCGRF